MAEEVWTDPRFHRSHIVSGFEFENVLLSCGQNCPLEAKYCHKCRELLKQNVTEGAGSVDEGSKKDESGSKPGATGSGIGTSGLLTFAQFRS